MADITEITESLQKGVSEVFTSGNYQAYLDAMSRFYDYSANNCMLIMMQCPTATLIASFRKWKEEFHRTVKKGEKAIRIIAPIQHKSVRMKRLLDGSEEENEATWLSFRAVPVFDISQTEGSPLPSLVEHLSGSVERYAELVDKLISLAPVPVSMGEVPGSALGYYSGMEDRIVVQTGMSETQTVKTLVHEIAHSLLHRKGSEQEDAERHTREVQAESVAYTVCKWIGLDTSEYSFGYIAGWSAGKELKTLQTNLETIRRTAKCIIDGLQGKAEASAA